jgi:cytochrome c peroxidase
MRPSRQFLLLLCLFAANSVAAHENAGDAVTFDATEKRRILQHSPLPAVPADPTNKFADDPAAAHFGQFLFFETRLSLSGELSCASCHDPAKHFTDGRQLAEGMHIGRRHTPGLWNVAHNRWFFLDGRADTLWSQALHPMESGDELGSNRMRIVRTIVEDAALRRAYERIFGKLPDVSDEKRFPQDARPVPTDAEHAHNTAWLAMAEDDRTTVTRVFVNVGKALAAYERKLISQRSAFDEFAAALRSGDEAKMQAMDDAAQRGLKLFVGEANCRLCHSGPNFSDGEFHNIGVPPLGGGPPRDPGRLEGLSMLLKSPFRASEQYSDDPKSRAAERLSFMRADPEFWGQFKTPSLRNVAVTPPYMHQGQFATLRDVLMYYATLEGSTALHHQEPFLASLELDQIEDVEAFLCTLTDTSIDAGLLEKPASPVLQSE